MLFNEKDLQLRDFAVNKDFGDQESFFRIITDGGEVQLSKLKFQLNQPLPDTISCRIKGFNGNLPVLGHNMPRYVSDFYADGFQRGEEFDFKVIALPDDTNGSYRLTDDNGLIFKLHEPKATLIKGQTVKCKFDSMSQSFFSLRRSNTDDLYPMLSLGDIARIAALHGVGAARMESQLQKIEGLEKALEELNHGRSVWVITAIRDIRRIMPSLFRTAMTNVNYDTVYDIIRAYERVLLYLLQGSGYLRHLKGKERSNIQEEITEQLELLDILKRTHRIVSNNEQHKFINNLLDNLKESGYIYHPTTQFSIMMILFRMSPELVNTSLGNIFDTLMGWDLEIWKTEPFRQAFVEQLEIYIKETREEIDLFLEAETASDNEKIEKVLTAIAIQKSLATETDKMDMRINTSLFYRYLSLLRTAKADVLLEKSYLALMGVNLPTDYTWSDIKEPTMMMTRAAVDPPANTKLPSMSSYYMKDDIEIEINQEGITISKTNEDPINQIYNGMLPWPGNGLKVKTELSRPFKSAKMKSMEGHAEFWNDIENSLFLKDEDSSEQIATRRMPDIDDTVRIIIDRVIPSANDFNKIEAFECKIVDDHFIEARGILPAENIVNYNLHGVTVGTFRHDNGAHMKFDAQVVDIDDNDTLIFSLAETAHHAIRDIANTGEQCYCVITKDNGRSYSAISDKGFGLYVNKENDGTPPFHRGNILKVSITGYANDAIQSVIEEGPIDNFTFYNARALHNLLSVIAVDSDYENQDNLQLDDDETLSSQDVREIIEIFRHKAISCNDDILRSFDYLSYARLMAIIINDTRLAATLKAHKDILLLHNHYAKNKSLFAEDIERITQQAPDSLYISRMAQRLKIVASLCQTENNAWLWDIVNKSNNETEKELAQMVLSHNLLYEMNHEDTTPAKIKDKIAKKLNVNSEQRNLKYYGSESQYVEFKSSLVYPAQKGKSGISKADPDKQEFEILHIIAGFLNTTGGTLYIGVSDDHYEHGLDDDFTYYRMDTSEKNNKYRRNIKSLDNAANYLQNLIDSSFNLGKNIGDYAKAAIDEESVKGVIAVKIDPCPHIVYLDNTIYTRHSAKTEPLIRKDEIELFIADRERLYKQLVAAAYSQDESAETHTKTEIDTPSQTINDTKDNDDSYADEQNQFSVKTSKIRKNILHEYNDPDHFVTPLCYIRFVDEDNYIVTQDEWSIEPESDRLVLTITEEEVEEYLLLVYEGEYAIKVKMKEVINKEGKGKLPHYTDRKLIFACPLSTNGGLYSLHSNNKNTLYERITPTDKISQGSLNSVPERIMDIDSIITVLWEIVSPDKMNEMSSIYSTTMKRTQIGALVKGSSSIKTSIEEAEKAILNKLS